MRRIGLFACLLMLVGLAYAQVAYRAQPVRKDILLKQTSVTLMTGHGTMLPTPDPVRGTKLYIWNAKYSNYLQDGKRQAWKMVSKSGDVIVVQKKKYETGAWDLYKKDKFYIAWITPTPTVTPTPTETETETPTITNTP